MMYIVTRFNINQQGTESHSQQRYDDDIAAMKRYYTVLATDIDNNNYQYELVQVVRSDGVTIASQVFDNPLPEPEPENVEGE